MISKLIPGLVFSVTLIGVGVSAGWNQVESGPAPGDPAPIIMASSWIKGEPVQSYEAGQVYIVDLWATWCKPCIESMPALKKLEKEYPEGLTVIAMNVWEMVPENVPKFMDSFGNSMPACVALDSIPPGKEVFEGLTTQAFNGTSDEIAIPKSFLIDQHGRVAWIGHPEEIEGPLSKVLAGTWDMDQEKQEAEGE